MNITVNNANLQFVKASAANILNTNWVNGYWGKVDGQTPSFNTNENYFANQSLISVGNYTQLSLSWTPNPNASSKIRVIFVDSENHNISSIELPNDTIPAVINFPAGTSGINIQGLSALLNGGFDSINNNISGVFS